MADLFSKKDMENLLRGKYILILGDSNMRALYKDLVWLICKGTLICSDDLRAKGEFSYLGDKRVSFEHLTRGRNYLEDREFYHLPSKTRIEFRFITRVLSDATRSMLKSMASQPSQAPSVLLINSTVWDLRRWGPQGDAQFRTDLRELMGLLQSCLPSETLVAWVTALHPAGRIRGSALIVKQLEQIQNSLQFQILEANFYAASVAKEFGFDVLDFHYYTRLLSHRRRPDGIHYDRDFVRYLSNLVLTHIAEEWEIKLPGKVKHRDIEFIVQTKALGLHANTDIKDKNGVVVDIGDRKILQAKRKAKDKDDGKSEALLNSLVDKCTEGLMHDIEQTPELSKMVDNYFTTLLSDVTGDMNAGSWGRDPHSVEFYEDDIFGDQPPPGEWNNNTPVWNRLSVEESNGNNGPWRHGMKPSPFVFNEPNSYAMNFNPTPSSNQVFRFHAQGLFQQNAFRIQENSASYVSHLVEEYNNRCGTNFGGFQNNRGDMAQNFNMGNQHHQRFGQFGRHARWNQR